MPQDVGLLISAYTLPGIPLIPVLGFLADRFGRKKIIVPSLMLFGIAGGACAFARDFNLLLILRFLQGLGSTSLVPLGVTIICDIYSDRERSEAVGYNAGFINVGHAIFPTIGGAIALLGWYYPFLIYFVAVPVGLIVLFSLKNPEPNKRQNLGEYLGNAWQSMKNRNVIGVFIASTFTFVILFGSYQTYFPLLIGNSFGASPLIIGLIMSTMFLVAAISSSRLGKLAKTYSERNLLIASFSLYTIALIIIPLVPNIWLILIPTIIFGIGHGINIPTRHTLIAKYAPPEHRAAFLAINETFLLVGLTSGPILMGIIFGISGIGGVFFAGALFSIAMLIIGMAMTR